jgi:hypothetical protein
MVPLNIYYYLIHVTLQCKDIYKNIYYAIHSTKKYSIIFKKITKWQIIRRIKNIIFSGFLEISVNELHFWGTKPPLPLRGISFYKDIFRD